MSKYDNEWLAEELNRGVKLEQLSASCGIERQSMGEYIRRHLKKVWIPKREGRRGGEIHNT